MEGMVSHVTAFSESWIKKATTSLTAMALAGVCAGTALVAQAAVAPQAAHASSCACNAAASVEEHTFSGSSTSVAVFEAWFAGGDFVQPELETMDLRHLHVNETQTAEPGDVVFKDANGNFWVKSAHC